MRPTRIVMLCFAALPPMTAIQHAPAQCQTLVNRCVGTGVTGCKELAVCIQGVATDGDGYDWERTVESRCARYFGRSSVVYDCRVSPPPGYSRPSDLPGCTATGNPGMCCAVKDVNPWVEETGEVTLIPFSTCQTEQVKE